jgi:hypothetical protein
MAIAYAISNMNHVTIHVMHAVHKPLAVPYVWRHKLHMYLNLRIFNPL